MIAYKVGSGGYHRISRTDLDYAMHSNGQSGLTELSSVKDSLSSELRNNDRDSDHDRL